MKPYIVIIAGPTASGKTGIGVECSKMFNGEIISADSMQIYKGMDINTAKVTESEMSGIKHHMLDVVDADNEYSVSEYVLAARKCIDDIISRGKLPIIVGGTGLYIKSLICDYDFANSQKDDSIRQKYQDILEQYGKEYLHNLLKNVDPESAEQIHPNNTKRVIRALEIYETTGTKKSAQQTNNNEIYDYTMIVLYIPRNKLYERINMRVDMMIKDGGEAEAKHFVSTLDSNCQSMQAIGYKEFAPYFEGKISLSQATDNLKQLTRNYAKRQITYFKSFDKAIWLNPLTQKDEIFNKIREGINEYRQ